MATARLTTNRTAARTLGEALRSVGFSEDELSELLGDDAFPGERGDVPVSERRLPDTALGTVVRALFLQLPTSTDEAVRALGRPAVDALEETGVADVTDEVGAEACSSRQAERPST